MNKNLKGFLTFFLVLVVYLSFLEESKIESLGEFFHPIAWVIILMIGKKTLKELWKVIDKK